MKKINFKKAVPVVLLAGIGIGYACKKTLDKALQSQIQLSSLANKAGVNGLLIGAYSMLDGVGAAGTTGVPGLLAPSGSGGVWEVSADNWIYGSMAGGDAHKGSTVQDQGTFGLPIETYSVDPSNLWIEDRWIGLYASIQRCNDVLRAMAQVKDGSLSPADTVEIRAESVFLRGLYHFEAKKLWGNIPYIDESITLSSNNYHVPNTTDAWPMIEADFQYAIANLPATQSDKGRATSWAAKAFLAKSLMFQHKLSDAYTIIKDIIANGVTSQGAKYALSPNYFDNFDPAKKNGPESIFAAQSSVKDNAQGENGNPGNVLNYPYGGPTTCCGFFQPSYSIVNSYKVDPTTGLPLLDNFNDADIKNDEGIATWNYASDYSNKDTFQTYTGTLDPRIDWSVGRRGIPYLDWGLNPGAAWVREQSSAGPYQPIKNAISKANSASYGDQYGGWAPNQSTAINYNYIRYADVLLWAAECAVDAGDLQGATDFVNQVRTRMTDPTQWVHKYNVNTFGVQDPSQGSSNTPAANYKIGLYPTFASADYATQAIRFERKIELANEGHRFFDLQRWDNGSGYMADQLNAYIAHEGNYNHSAVTGKSYVYPPFANGGAKFTKGRNELYPIPQGQIDASLVGSTSSLTQNPGY